ncbi:MAG: efflux RND transporter periplasmic adaptor subunit [Pseudomonadota bacterium]
MRNKRVHLFFIVGLVIAGISLTYGTYYYFIGSRYVSTDNAYVGAEISQVTASTGGIVKEIKFKDTDTVKTGDILVMLDNTDAQLTLARAEADLAKANAETERTKSHFTRYQALSKSGAISAEDINNAENAYKSAKAVSNAASIVVEQAIVDLSRTIIKSQVDGIVAKRQVQLGQRAQSGMPLMSIVPIADVHVDANFKEVQLRKVRIGQPVELTSDYYGSSVVYHGKVSGIAGGTGAAFAMIPAQNATGNWIKVVQRLPVRITINPDDLKKNPLYVGLSMQVEIDISDAKR